MWYVKNTHYYIFYTDNHVLFGSSFPISWEIGKSVERKEQIGYPSERVRLHCQQKGRLKEIEFIRLSE